MPVQVNIRHLEAKDIVLKGELPVTELELGDFDELVHARRPLLYDLTAQKVGDDIVAQGSLTLTLDCECARCLKSFQHVVRLEPWIAHFPLSGPEKAPVAAPSEVGTARRAVRGRLGETTLPRPDLRKAPVQDDLADLTPQIREDILLEFPQHPLCGADCAGLPNRSKDKKKGAGQIDGSSAWSELNKLKF